MKGRHQNKVNEHNCTSLLASETLVRCGMRWVIMYVLRTWVITLYSSRYGHIYIYIYIYIYNNCIFSIIHKVGSSYMIPFKYNIALAWKIFLVTCLRVTRTHCWPSWVVKLATQKSLYTCWNMKILIGDGML